MRTCDCFQVNGGRIGFLRKRHVAEGDDPDQPFVRLTTGSRRISSSAMLAATSSTSWSSKQYLISPLMTCCTGVAGARFSATARTAMSRSVNMPTSLSSRCTATLPTSFSRISSAASAIVCSGVTRNTSPVITSPTRFMIQWLRSKKLASSIAAAAVPDNCTSSSVRQCISTARAMLDASSASQRSRNSALAAHASAFLMCSMRIRSASNACFAPPDPCPVGTP